jgi:hypothetical protein
MNAIDSRNARSPLAPTSNYCQGDFQGLRLANRHRGNMSKEGEARLSASASPTKQRRAALQMRLGKLTTQVLLVDCATAGCHGPRPFLARELIGVYGRGLTLATALKRMRCGRCGGLPVRASLMTATVQRDPTETVILYPEDAS